MTSLPKIRHTYTHIHTHPSPVHPAPRARSAPANATPPAAHGVLGGKRQVEACHGLPHQGKFWRCSASSISRWNPSPPSLPALFCSSLWYSSSLIHTQFQKQGPPPLFPSGTKKFPLPSLSWWLMYLSFKKPKPNHQRETPLALEDESPFYCRD